LKTRVYNNSAEGRIADLSSPRLRMDSSDSDFIYTVSWTHVIQPAVPNGISIGSFVLDSLAVCPPHRHTDHYVWQMSQSAASMLRMRCGVTIKKRQD